MGQKVNPNIFRLSNKENWNSRYIEKKSNEFYFQIKTFDVRGSTLVVAVQNVIQSLSADSLQSMAGAMKFENVNNHIIMSLVFSKDGKYYLFTLIMHICINYDLQVTI